VTTAVIARQRRAKPSRCSHRVQPRDDRPPCTEVPSRELSTKVFAGQGRLIEKGFRQGGPAGFGLRRTLIDEHGAIKGVLVRGEHKSIQTDRVILTPGPDEEVALVRDVYRAFVHEGRSESVAASRSLRLRSLAAAAS